MPTENRSSNTEIKPCPFCGEKAELRCTAGPDPDWFVQCAECRASADVFSEDNLTGWNDRAHPPTSDGFSAGDMADQGAKAFAARDGEVQELRTKLTERDALLREALCHAQRLEPMSASCFNRIDAALSASAEPSECEHRYMHFGTEQKHRRCADCFKVEPEPIKGDTQ
ncbi:hypothetical protein D3C77_410320 [compost metagenome]